MNDAERDELLIRIDERTNRIESWILHREAQCKDLRTRCQARVNNELNEIGGQVDGALLKLSTWRTLAIGLLCLLCGAGLVEAGVLRWVAAVLP